MTIACKEIDLSKGVKSDHPDISTDKMYMVKIYGEWFFGPFTRQHYGLNFKNWGMSGAQFDTPGYNSSGWERVIEIDPETLCASGHPRSARAAAGLNLPDDLFSHRSAWRFALANLRDGAEAPDNGYWQHEIDVFDRTFGALESKRRASEAATQSALDVAEVAANTPKDAGDV